MDLYHILLIHSSIGGHLGSFHFLAIASSAIMHVFMYVHFFAYLFRFFGV